MSVPAQQDGWEPIDAEEILYRRIPVFPGWYDASSNDPLSDLAYRPRHNDETGISLTRAKYSSINDAARGISQHGYYVALLKAGDLTSSGLDVAPRPLENSAGHCEVTNLRADNQKSTEVYEWSALLVALTIRVEGPFL